MEENHEARNPSFNWEKGESGKIDLNKSNWDKNKWEKEEIRQRNETQPHTKNSEKLHFHNESLNTIQWKLILCAKVTKSIGKNDERK